MKKRRVIILTTHQMEEVEILADRVAMIIDGEIRCVGTPLILKRHWGERYSLSLVAESYRLEEVENLVQKLIPRSVQLSNNSGLVTYTIPANEHISLKIIFGLMENKERLNDEGIDREKYKKLKSLVKDVELSYPTLDEVFMRLATKKEKRLYNKTLTIAAAASD